MTLAIYEQDQRQWRSNFYPTAQPWTEAEIDAMKALLTQGLSASQIADQLPGRTRNSIIGKVNRILGKGHLTRPSVDPERRAMLNEQRKQRRNERGREYRAAPRWKPGPRAMIHPNDDPNVDLDNDPSIGVPLLDLRKDQCRFIAGDPHAAAPYCGCEVVLGAHYCGFHYRRMYQPSRPR